MQVLIDPWWPWLSTQGSDQPTARPGLEPRHPNSGACALAPPSLPRVTAGSGWSGCSQACQTPSHASALATLLPLSGWGGGRDTGLTLSQSLIQSRASSSEPPPSVRETLLPIVECLLGSASVLVLSLEGPFPHGSQPEVPAPGSCSPPLPSSLSFCSPQIPDSNTPQGALHGYQSFPTRVGATYSSTDKEQALPCPPLSLTCARAGGGCGVQGRELQASARLMRNVYQGVGVVSGQGGHLSLALRIPLTCSVSLQV